MAQDPHRLLSAFVAVAQSSSAIAAQDLSFHRALDRKFASSVDHSNSRLTSIARSLLHIAAPGEVLEITDVDSITHSWGDIVDIVDSLFEKADICLDEFSGTTKRHHPQIGNRESRPKKREKLDPRLYHAHDLPRPQERFKVPPTNQEPFFHHKLLSKPHAMVPLDSDTESEIQQHPYTYEVWNSQYPCQIMQIAKPSLYLPFESTSAIWVDDLHSLEEMLAELQKSKEIAVDLEHHDYRSFSGFVCLMQISTRERDWIVDTLQLREELQCLNDVFADSSIIKVFHGAQMDIIWLQRDFGLYIVSLFDTYHAAKALGFSSRGLAFLLERYADFDADKKYQLADWRLRPLPQEMLLYARSDTHFLLFIYDNLRNELLEKSADHMEQVLRASRGVAALSYQPEVYDVKNGLGPEGWKSVYNKYGTTKLISETQMYAFRALHEWRDRVARQLDESVRYVLPSHMMVSLAAALPKDVVELYANPLTPIVKNHANDILQVFQQVLNKNVEKDVSEQFIDRNKSPSFDRFNWCQLEAVKPDDLLTSTSSFWRVSPEDKGERDDMVRRIGSQLRIAVPLPCSQLKVDEQTVPSPPNDEDEIIIPRISNKRARTEESTDVAQFLVDFSKNQVGIGKKRKKKKVRLEEGSKPVESFEPFAKLLETHMNERPVVGKSRMNGKSGTF